MINVNQITSQLAKMPDQMLQKFAAMHKDDPYTVSLALAESNRRKELRAGAQAPMAGQQMPKVVDQEVAQMLPENVGIGQLPAQNLQKMATGGIVAFEEGGEVPRYQNKGQVELPGGLGIYSQGAFGPQQGDAELQARIARIEANPRMRREDKDALIAQAKAEFGMPKAAGAALAAAPTVVAPPAQTNTGPAPAPVAGPTTDTTQQTPPAAPPAAPAATPVPGLPSINAYMKQFEMALPKKEEAQSEETFMNKRQEPMKAFFDKANTQIETERARLKTDKEQDFYMALIQGGLAAAAEAGPNALQNIAKGLSTGASSYKDALKDFRKASQENSKMELELMRAKAADQKGDMDAYQKHMESVAERNSKIDGYKVSGLASIIGHKMSADATMAAAGAPSGTERLIGRIGSDPKFAAAYEKYASMGPNAKLPNQILAKYADPKELMKLKVMDPDLYEQVRAQLAMTAGIGAPPIPQVLNQPSGNVRP
jgi:hypothetical protein